MKRKPIILITNDDGIDAKGIAALRRGLAKLGTTYVFAPKTEKSGASHAFSLRKPLEVQWRDRTTVSIDGTPTDCVMLAVRGLMKIRPDLVVSGINHGPNLGNDVHYSGTVAAAIEGALLGVPALAISLAGPAPHQFADAARFAAALARQMLSQDAAAGGAPAPLLLNVNVPPGPVRGFRFTRLGRRTYGNDVVEKTDPRGRKYYWIGGEGGARNDDIPGSDCNAVRDGLASVTPLHLDPTHDAVLTRFRDLPAVPGYAKDEAP
jgi:5'-nucleotidase